MINNEYGKYYAVCDECGETQGPFFTWQDAKDYMEQNDWGYRYDRNSGEHIHTCEVCR